MKYYKSENIILNEIFRKLGYFKDWNLYSELLIILYPSEAKGLKDKGIIKSIGIEKKGISNWYGLDLKGIELFFPITQNRKRKISQLLNEKMFKGKILIDFNKLNK